VHGGPRYPCPRRDLRDRGLGVALGREQFRRRPHDPGPGGGGLLTPQRRLVAAGLDDFRHLMPAPATPRPQYKPQQLEIHAP
jgi:hypothetical protein